MISTAGCECDATGVAARLAASASVELTPTEVNGHLAQLPGSLPPGARIFLTALPSRPLREQLVAAEKVRAAGFEPVPHIAARAYPGLGELQHQLSQLVSAAGVGEVLVVAGGQARPAGKLTSSLDVLRAGVVPEAGIRRIAVAGYPEEVRGIPARAVSEALAEKNELAAEQQLEMRILTQFAFHAAVYLDWERAVRSAGNRLPITVGMAGVVSVRKLMRFAATCGIGSSADILRKQARNVLKLASSAWRPDALLTGIGEGIVRDRGCLIDALHLFAFGNVSATAEWLKGFPRDG